MREYRYGDVFDVELLKTFVRVARNQGMTKAASSLGLTQSAVSHQIKRLEQFTNQSLFKRLKSRLVLTAAGSKLLRHAEKILEIHYEAFEDLKLSPTHQEYRIGIPDVYWERLANLPWLHSHIVQEPKLSVRVHSDTSTKLYKLFDDGELDLCLAIRHDDHIRGEDVCLEKLVWTSSPSLKLSPHEKIPLVVFEEDCVYRRKMIRALEAADFDWSIKLISNNTITIRKAIESGVGISLLALSSLPPSLERLEEDFLQEVSPQVLELCISNSAHPLSQILRDVIFDHFSGASRSERSSLR